MDILVDNDVVHSKKMPLPKGKGMVNVVL